MCGAIDLRELAPPSVGKGAADRVATLRREAAASLPAASFELRAPDRATVCAWAEVLAARRAKQLSAAACDAPAGFGGDGSGGGGGSSGSGSGGKPQSGANGRRRVRAPARRLPRQARRLRRVLEAAVVRDAARGLPRRRQREQRVLAEAALGGHAGAARLLLAVGADPDRLSETQGAMPRSCAASPLHRP